MNSQSKYIFIDRDGTLIKLVPYISEAQKVKILPGVIEGLTSLKHMGYQFFIVTNQSGLGRGYFSEFEYQNVNKYMLQIFRDHDIEFEGVYHCPHVPEDYCLCRKPNWGLVKKAILDKHLNLTDCALVGDSLCDIELGKKMDIPTFLIRTGNGVFVEKSKKKLHNCIVVDSLIEIAVILRELH